MLLAGPPGNGKTTLAEALADAMGVGLFVVRYEVVIGSYLGETAQRIAKVFEHARLRHVCCFSTSLTRLARNGATPTKPARSNGS